MIKNAAAGNDDLCSVIFSVFFDAGRMTVLTTRTAVAAAVPFMFYNISYNAADTNGYNGNENKIKDIHISFPCQKSIIILYTMKAATHAVTV